MSLVSIIGTEKFITIMSDGRVSGPDGLPIQEDYQKFYNIDNRSFVAMAGAKELCEMIFRDLEEGLFKKSIDYDLWLQTIEQIINGLDLKTNGYVISYAFGGINSNDQIQFNTITSATMEKQRYFPVNDEIKYALLNNTKHSTEFFTEKLIQFFRETGFETPSQTIQAQRLLNNFVAENDKSVNMKTFRMVIRKHDFIMR